MRKLYPLLFAFLALLSALYLTGWFEPATTVDHRLPGFSEEEQGDESAALPLSNTSDSLNENPTGQKFEDSSTENKSSTEVANLIGRVVDEAGTPIESAIVYLADERVYRFDVARDSAADTRRETNSEGEFLFEGLSTEDRFNLFVQAEGWVGRRVKDVKPSNERVDVVLPVGETVTGVVVDPNLRRVAGAIVSAGIALTQIESGIFLPVDLNVDSDLLNPEAMTREDGTFVLTGVPRSEFSIGARHENWGPSQRVNLTRSQDAVTLKLRENAGVEGIVVDHAGQPVEGARLSLRRVGLLFGEDLQRQLPQTESEEHGEFQLRGLQAGTFNLRATADGFPRLSRLVDLEEGQILSGLVMQLELGSALTGVVLNSDGLPVAGARVSLLSELSRFGDLQVHTEPNHRTQTDDAGGFTLESIDSEVDSQSWFIKIDSDHYRRFEGDLPNLIPGELSDLGSIILEDSLLIRGKITDQAGQPIEGAQVELTQDDGSQNQAHEDTENRSIFRRTLRPNRVGLGQEIVSTHGTTDSDGRYQVKVPQPGRYRLLAAAGGYQKGETGPIEVVESDWDDVDLILLEGLSISGRVVDQLGNPCSEVRVRAASSTDFNMMEVVFSPEQIDRGQAITDVDGFFRIEGLEDQAYRVSCVSKGWKVLGEPPVVDAGEDSVNLVVTRPGQIAGRVVDSVNGGPISQFSLSIQPERSEIFPSSSSIVFDFPTLFGGEVEYRDPDGEFFLENIAVGKHKLLVKAGNRTPKNVSVEVLPGRTTEVVVQLEAAGSIRGVVVDLSGRPIQGARVRAIEVDQEGDQRGSSNNISGSIVISRNFGFGEEETDMTNFFFSGGENSKRTGEDGVYLLDGLSDGEYRIEVSHRLYRKTNSPEIPVRRGEISEATVVIMEQGAVIRGTIQPPTNSNLAWATISLRRSGVNFRREESANRSGEFGLGGLEEGAYQVEVNYSLVQLHETAAIEYEVKVYEVGTIELGADEERILNLTLPAN